MARSLLFRRLETPSIVFMQLPRGVIDLGLAGTLGGSKVAVLLEDSQGIGAEGGLDEYSREGEESLARARFGGNSDSAMTGAVMGKIP